MLSEWSTTKTAPPVADPEAISGSASPTASSVTTASRHSSATRCSRPRRIPSQMPVSAKSGTSASSHSASGRAQTRDVTSHLLEPAASSPAHGWPERRYPFDGDDQQGDEGEQRPEIDALLPRSHHAGSGCCGQRRCQIRVDTQIRLPLVTGVDDKARRSEIDSGRVSFGDGVDTGGTGIGVDDVPRDRSRRDIALVFSLRGKTGSSAGSPEGGTISTEAVDARGS